MWHRQMALVLAKQGSIGQALPHAEKAATLAPHNAAYHGFHADLCSKLNLWPEAQKSYKAALALRPDNEAWLLRLAIVEGKLRNWVDAEAALQKISGEKKEGSLWHRQMALVLTKQGSIDQALPHAEKAAILAPHNAAYHGFHADLCSKLNLWPEAQKSYKAALALRPDNEAWLLRLAFVEKRLGNWIDSKKYTNLALELNASEKFSQEKDSYLHTLSQPHQYSGWTRKGRNLSTFSEMRDVILSTDITSCAGMKILSFGCSVGYECIDLYNSFPMATIYGCDVGRRANKAKHTCADKAIIFDSNEIEHYAPFDIIIAMNVFCRIPATIGEENISEIYPFSIFDDAIKKINVYLRIGGYFCLYNSQYFFEDTSSYKQYIPCKVIFPHSNGFIEKYLQDGERAVQRIYMIDNQMCDAIEFKKWSFAHRDVALDEKGVSPTYTWIHPKPQGNRSLQTILWKKVSS